MTLAEKIDLFESSANEVAFGWNDSGSFWHFRRGGRGTGYMIPDFGDDFSALEADTFEEALDAALAHWNIRPTEDRT